MKRVRMFRVLPTLLTLGNAVCGFGAITFAAKVGPETLEKRDLFTAAILIFLAMLFDMLDGRAARWAKHTTDFGAQLDSLCDAVSFGIAPAFLMLQFMRPDPGTGVARLPFDYPPRLLWVIAALFAVCVLLRLARFNVETGEEDTHEDFSGLPSPAAAGTVASFPIPLHGLRNLVEEADTFSHQLATWLIPVVRISLPIVTLAVACLMVSRIRYPHVFNQLFRGRKPRQHLIQIVFTAAVVFVVKEMAVPLIFCYYAFAAPLKALWKEVTAGRFGGRGLHKTPMPKE